MRPRCWGSVFLEDLLSLFHEARAAAVDRRVHARLRTLRRSLLILQCRQDARWGEELRARGPVLLSGGVRGRWAVYCTRLGCYWGRVGCTAWGPGVRAVWITLGQWIPTLVE